MLFVGCDQTLFVTFSADVLSTFQVQQQLHFWQRERGGLLFARSVGRTDGRVDVVQATGPNPWDKSGRTWLKLDHRRCLNEITTRFEAGLHFVGYWHTHPEIKPKLSGQDIASAWPLMTDPGIDLARLLLVVVGGNQGSTALDVSVLDRRNGDIVPLQRDHVV
jgi:hypothetical protein